MAVRVATPDDQSAIRRVAVSSGLFPADGLDWVGPMLADPDNVWMVDEADGAVRGATLLAPEAHGDRVWNALFLAVDAAWHRHGIGRTLMQALETHLRDQGTEVARILLVETSSTAPQDAARAFYASIGFTEEARIRGYYGDGDDKVVFWKTLEQGG